MGGEGFQFPYFDRAESRCAPESKGSEVATTLASAARDEIGERNAVREMWLLSAKKDVAEKIVSTRVERRSGRRA